MISLIFSMKRRPLVHLLSLAALALGMCMVSIAAGMDGTPKAAPSETDGAPTNAAPPKSIFDLSQPYKDPFFPNSTRHRVQAATNVVVNTWDPTQYALKGISGVPGQEVVIINNRNAEAGETVDVTLASGSVVRIKVVKIEQYAAWILPEGQHDPFPIYLPKDDR
jgi:hypothetical protein